MVLSCGFLVTSASPNVQLVSSRLLFRLQEQRQSEGERESDRLDDGLLSG